jgi:hypothetical protein
MKTNRKIIFFIVTTLILGAIAYLIISKLAEKDNNKEVEEKNTVAIVEDIDYAKYMELRSKVYENETYAILIWNSEAEVSIEYFGELKIAFENRKSKIYAIDTSKMSKEDFSRIIDDVTAIMKYESAMIIVPTTIVMSKGDIVYKHDGLKYRDELIENLNAKSIE